MEDGACLPLSARRRGSEARGPAQGWVAQGWVAREHLLLLPARLGHLLTCRPVPTCHGLASPFPAPSRARDGCHHGNPAHSVRDNEANVFFISMSPSRAGEGASLPTLPLGDGDGGGQDRARACGLMGARTPAGRGWDPEQP